MFRRYLPLLSCALLVAVWGPSSALAQLAPNLNSEAPFAIVSSTYTNSNTAPQTIINGQVCYTTPPGTAPILITGAVTTPCPVATGTDQGNATAFLNSEACTSLGAIVALDSAPGHPTGTYGPGCYSSTGAMNITLGTTVTLSGAGVYIFRSGGAITTGANSLVTTANGACANDVFWTAIGATTLGANAVPALVTPTFIGNILDAAGITLGHFANLGGRALAFGGTVKTDANTITVPSCSSGAPVPALPPLALVALMLLLLLGGAIVVRSRSQSGPRSSV